MDANTQVFSGVAEFYDAYRPSPPDELPDILSQLAQVVIPSFVVDLGSGTGLSTLLWKDRAETVIGIEPNDDMRMVAQQRLAALETDHPITFRQGVGNDTGLANASVDIVTCAQSFHWMEPASTLAEIARILRSGGVFAAYDYQWAPTVNWQAEAVYEKFIERVWKLQAERDAYSDVHNWTENKQLTPLQGCGQFRFTKEFWLHRQEMGNADRFIGLTLTNGVIQFLQRGVLREDEIELATFKQQIQELIGSEPIPWYFSYHVRIGVK